MLSSTKKSLFSFKALKNPSLSKSSQLLSLYLSFGLIWRAFNTFKDDKFRLKFLLPSLRKYSIFSRFSIQSVSLTKSLKFLSLYLNKEMSLNETN